VRRDERPRTREARRPEFIRLIKRIREDETDQKGRRKKKRREEKKKITSYVSNVAWFIF
jgi:hypothetical protein